MTTKPTHLEARDLTRALKPIALLTGKRQTIPILNCVRITAGQGWLTFTGTDMDLEVTTNVAAITAAPWQACVEVKALFAIASRLPPGAPVALAPTKAGKGVDADLAVSAPDLRLDATLHTLPVEDFPTMTQPEDCPEVIPTFPVGLLRDAIGRVRHAISTEETRYYLNGICFETDGEDVRLTATDGHRLASTALASVRLVEDMKARFGHQNMAVRCILPKEAVRHLLAVMPKSGDVGFRFTRGSGGKELAVVQWDGYRLLAKMIDGTFPEWRRVLPSAKDAVAIEVTADALMRAVSLVTSVYTARKHKHVRLDFEGERLAVASVDGPESAGKIAAMLEAGAPAEAITKELLVGVNGDYLGQIIKAMDQQAITILLNRADAGRHPIMFLGRPGDINVCMPVRI